jgi:ribose transport system substrate-binding protein
MAKRISEVRTLVAIGCGAVALSFGLAACGDSGSSGGSSSDPKGVAEAGKLVQAAKQPVQFKAPGPAFDAGAAKGKTVYVIAQSLAIQFTRDVTNGLKEALAKAGVNVQVVDDKADISQTARLLAQGTALKPAAIVVAERSDLLQAPLRQVKEAGIPVITQFNHDPRLPGPAEQDLGVTADVSYCYSCAGRLISDYAINESQGNVDAVGYWSPDDGVGKYEIDGMKNEQARLCPDCQTDFKDVLISQWQRQIPTLTQTDLRANPNLTYFLPTYDGMTPFMLPAIHAANAQDKVNIVTFNADKFAVEDMKDGDVIRALVGSPLKWFGYATADEVLRIITGQQPVVENVPLRIFDQSNAPDTSTDESTWYGADFQSEYAKLWGLD